jgi:hypothetical protein
MSPLSNLGSCSSPERRQRSLGEQLQLSPRQLLEGPPLAIAPDSISTRRRGYRSAVLTADH